MSSVNEWPMVKLGDIQRKVSSINPAKSPDQEFSLYSIPAYDAGAPEKALGSAIKSNKIELQPGDTLLSKIVPHIRRSWIVDEHETSSIGSSEWIVYQDDRLDSRFLRNFFLSDYFHAQFMQTVAGVGGSLNRARPAAVAQISIPIPPRPEQQRIAEILDQAQSLVNDSVLLEAKSEALLKACFISTFGHPLDPENSTNRQRVGAVSKVVTGNTPPRKDPSNYGSTVEWLKSDNLGGLQPTPAAESLSDVGATKARIVGSGSTLITCIAGSRESIGKSSLLDRTAAFNQQINAIVPGEELDPLFLFAQVKTAPELVRRKATDGMKGIVSKKTLESVKILVPSIDTQRHYSETATEILALKEHTQLRTSELRDLHESLSTRAFAGQL